MTTSTTPEISWECLILTLLSQGMITSDKYDQLVETLETCEYEELSERMYELLKDVRV